MENQKQQQQDRSRRPFNFVEEFLAFTSEARELHLGGSEVYSPHSMGGGVSSPRGASGGPQVISPSSLSDLGEGEGLNCNEEIAGWIDRIRAPSAPGSSAGLSLRSLEPRGVRKFLTEYADYERMVTGGVRESGEPLELLPMKSFVDWEVLAGLQMEYQEEHLQHPKRPIPQVALLQALQKINDGSPIENEDEEDSLVGAAASPPPGRLAGEYCQSVLLPGRSAMYAGGQYRNQVYSKSKTGKDGATSAPTRDGS